MSKIFDSVFLSDIIDDKEEIEMYKVKERREEKGWSQEKLAVESGVSRAIVSALENDNTIPTTTNTLFKLARALDCKVADIFME